MRWVRLLLRIVRSQARNLIWLISGVPVSTPPLGSATLDEDDVKTAREWLRDRSKWSDEGTVRRFEEAFAEWNGSRFAFAFMGGRAALSACLHALGLQSGDEVIVPGYTCVVVTNALRFAAIKPVYADIELETYGLDVRSLEERITPRTRAIILQHLYGLVSRDYEAVIQVARSKNLWVIEDCAHSTGAEYHGVKVGNRGDVAFYSSEQSKVFNTIQGGIAVTNTPDLAERLRVFQMSAGYPAQDLVDRQLHNVILNYYRFKHPQRWWLRDLVEFYYSSKELQSTTALELQGVRPSHYGKRMPAPVAALGLNQLGKLNEYNRRRRQAAQFWDDWCTRRGYKPPLVIEGATPVFLRYPVLVDPGMKQNTNWARKELGITLGVWFVGGNHPVDGVLPDCPNAALAVSRCVNFPTLMFQGGLPQ